MFLTAGAAVNWFRKRRAIRFQRVSDINLSNRIMLTGVNIKPIDKMFLRIYFSAGQESHNNFHKTTTVSYKDILLGDQKEIQIPLENT